jgi:hypothetical protein
MLDLDSKERFGFEGKMRGNYTSIGLVEQVFG